VCAGAQVDWSKSGIRPFSCWMAAKWVQNRRTATCPTRPPNYTLQESNVFGMLKEDVGVVIWQNVKRYSFGFVTTVGTHYPGFSLSKEVCTFFFGECKRYMTSADVSNMTCSLSSNWTNLVEGERATKLRPVFECEQAASGTRNVDAV